MLLLLALPILTQRYLARWPWSFKSFEKYSISTIWCHTINAISRYCCVGHNCKRLRLPEVQSKILRFCQSYPEYCILSWFPRCYRRTFLWNCEIIMSSFLLWVFSKKVLSVSGKQPDELYLSPFLPESIHIPMEINKSVKVLFDTSASSSAEKLENIPLNLDRLRYLPSVLE